MVKGEEKAEIGDEVMMGGGEIWRAGIADSRDGVGRAIECAREWASVPDRCDGPLWAAAPGMRVVGGG